MLSCFCLTLAIGQSKTDIQYIRNKYKQVKTSIDLSANKKEKSDLYCAIWENNAHASMLGEHSKTQFWYNHLPDISEDMGEDPRATLEMVIDKYSIDNGQLYYKEFLFDKGQLIFVYSRYAEQTNKAKEIRLYFKNNRLIKQLGEQQAEVNDKEHLINEAEFKMKLFLTNFGVK